MRLATRRSVAALRVGIARCRGAATLIEGTKIAKKVTQLSIRRPV
jgi:hypothetical protein